MANNDLALIAHLLRRAGFGASRAALEAYAAKGYAAVVEELLHPDQSPEVDEDLIERYFVGEGIEIGAAAWIYRMINSQRPLQEKMALFWHHVFATAWFKSEHVPSMNTQIELFRQVGLSNLRTVLIELSKDPAMLYWLDNHENHKGAPNENYGRELLELFSMGVGHYSELDIKMAARAFSGWTFTQPIPLYPNGNYPATFVYRADDHDDSIKTFLGHTGRLNGEDIVDVIVTQPVTAGFICRHLYNFFVADEPQVPAWSIVPPRDPAAIAILTRAFEESKGNLADVLRVLFNSDFFKAARFEKVKSPAELVVGVIKLVGTHKFPDASLLDLGTATNTIGQELMNPPTVEGWHTGTEWINGGTLNERVNFAVNQLADLSKPGIQDLVTRLAARDGVPGGSWSAEELVDHCLDLVGPLEVGEATRGALVDSEAVEGPVRFDTEEERQKSAPRVGRLIQLIVASREYQFN